MAEVKETKTAMFSRIVNHRTNLVIRRIRQLGKASDTARYEYSGAQVAEVFDAIQAEINAAKARFQPSNGNKVSEFKLGKV